MLDRKNLLQSRQIKELREMELLARQTVLAQALEAEQHSEDAERDAERGVVDAHSAWSAVLERGGFSPDLLRLNAVQIDEAIQALHGATNDVEAARKHSEIQRQRCAEAQAQCDVAGKLQSDLLKRTASDRDARLEDAVSDLVTQRWRRS